MVALLAACADGDPRSASETGPTPWTHQRFLGHEDDFRFAIVGDHQGLHREGVFETAVGKLNALQPEFVMSVGDLVTGYVWDPAVGKVDSATLDRRWTAFEAVVAELHAPFFYVPGNNDLNGSVALAAWRRWRGDTYYAFTHGDVLFVALDSDDPPPTALTGDGGISDTQLRWLGSILDAHEDVRWTFLFLHRPLWREASTETWTRVQDRLADRPYTVFAGHWHEYAKQQVRGRTHYTLATTGGMSDLGGVEVGEFDHVMWVTMTREGPVVANILLDGLWGDDPPNEVAPSAPLRPDDS